MLEPSSFHLLKIHFALLTIKPKKNTNRYSKYEFDNRVCDTFVLYSNSRETITYNLKRNHVYTVYVSMFSLLKKVNRVRIESKIKRFIHIAQIMANSRFDYVRDFETNDRILPNCWIVVRVDGKAFHKFTQKHNFNKPNDENGA